MVESTGFRRAVDDYLASLRLNADDPGAQVNLGNFHAARGESAEAERAYREALHLDPNRTSAYLNLADLSRQTNRDNDAEILLQEGWARQPQAPEDAQFCYVYAALSSVGHIDEARGVIETRLKRMPGDTSLNALYSQLATEN